MAILWEMELIELKFKYWPENVDLLQTLVEKIVEGFIINAFDINILKREFIIHFNINSKLDRDVETISSIENFIDIILRGYDEIY